MPTRTLSLLLLLSAAALAQEPEGPSIKRPPNPNEAAFEQLFAGRLDRRVIREQGVSEEAVLRAAARGCRIKRSANFLIATDLSERGLDDLALRAERAYKTLTELYGAEADPMRMLRALNMRRSLTGGQLRKRETMKLVVIDSKPRYLAFARAYFPHLGGAARGAGFADPATNTCVIHKSKHDLGNVAALHHELAHLVLDAIHSRAIMGQLPEWLHEGIATSCETLDSAAGEAATGLGDVNAYRLGLVSTSSCSSAKIVAIESTRGSGGARQQARCWALYHFLRFGPSVDYRRRLAAYERAVCASYFPSTEAATQEGARMFKEAMGDLKALDKALKAHVKGLKKQIRKR